MRGHTESHESIKGWVDRDELTYEVRLPSGKLVASEGPFDSIDDLIRHFQTYQPGVWLTTLPKPEEPDDDS